MKRGRGNISKGGNVRLSRLCVLDQFCVVRTLISRQRTVMNESGVIRQDESPRDLWATPRNLDYILEVMQSHGKFLIKRASWSDLPAWRNGI